MQSNFYSQPILNYLFFRNFLNVKSTVTYEERKKNEEDSGVLFDGHIFVPMLKKQEFNSKVKDEELGPTFGSKEQVIIIHLYLNLNNKRMIMS